MSDDDRPPPPIPDRLTLEALREAVQGCRACELWADATQAVMGHWEQPPRRRDAYVTNVVKHFRFRSRGKRRIHQTPERAHIVACRPWLDAELRVVRPQALVCLGATAAHALLGPQVRVGRDRGRPLSSDLAELVTLTTHPSAILRQRDDTERAAAMDEFVSDLSSVAGWLADRDGRDEDVGK